MKKLVLALSALCIAQAQAVVSTEGGWSRCSAPSIAGTAGLSGAAKYVANIKSCVDAIDEAGGEDTTAGEIHRQEAERQLEMLENAVGKAQASSMLSKRSVPSFTRKRGANYN